MERTLTTTEVSVVQWLLDNAIAPDRGVYRLVPPGELHVVGGCDCGCRSLDFAQDKDGAVIVADALAVYSDGRQAGLILWGREGRIVSLEIYDCHPEASRRFPEISDLRARERCGRELP